MALKRDFLQSLGLSDETIERIIAAHAETVSALTAERDALNTQVRQLTVGNESALADLEEQKKALKAVEKEYADFKSKQEQEATLRAKTEAYKALLEKAGVASKRIGSIMKVTDLSNEELDDSGAFVNEKSLEKTIKTEWSDFIQEPVVKGATTATPPEGQGHAKMDRASIMAIKDTQERQKAIAENLDAFEH